MNDELLNAYLDGELDAEKRQLVELYLAQNVSASLRLEDLKRADDLLRDAIPRVSTADDPIAKMIMTGERPRPRLKLISGGLKVVQKPWVRAVASMAAACVMGVFVGTAISGDRAPNDIDARMMLGPQMSSILDQTPSGQTAPVMGGDVQVALTLQTSDGRYCRQFRINAEESASDAVACRDNGRWHMIVQALAPQAGAGGAYHTAGADQGSAVDVAVDALGSTIVLDDREERAAMARRWRPTH
ncbi:MAG: hypothetical protein QM759_05230 [Terricaulis sp.]